MTETVQEEMIDMNELLGDKAELLEEEAQSNSVKARENEQKPLAERKIEEYISIYSGRALKPEELFRFSTNEDVTLVLIAGPYASGKTTLIVMLYRLFLEGYNKRLCFSGSKTMDGFRERSENLLCKSGQAEPSVARTSRGAEDWYLHLAISNAEERRQNIFFADISGETFSDINGLEMMAEFFSDNENVIIVVNGENLCDINGRNGEIFAADLMLKRLLNKKILSKKTKLQIVFTKKDKVDNCEKKEEVIRYIEEKEKLFINKFEAYVYSVKCIFLSALSEEPDECEKLEQIIETCMEMGSMDSNVDLQAVEYKIVRHFDRFQLRERG